MTNWTQKREADAWARCEAATAGGWEARPEGMAPALVARVWRDSKGRRCTQFIADFHQTRGWKDGQANSNAEFTAHAHTDLPDAIREIQRQREELKRVKQESAGWRRGYYDAP